jgi:hypothetical protein
MHALRANLQKASQRLGVPAARPLPGEDLVIAPPEAQRPYVFEHLDFAPSLDEGVHCRADAASGPEQRADTAAVGPVPKPGPEYDLGARIRRRLGLPKLALSWPQFLASNDLRGVPPGARPLQMTVKPP